MQNKDAEVTWHLAELQTLFHDVIAHPSLPLLEIFVDALDECNDDDVRRVVRSFADSAADAMSNKRRLRICWSSRHYPHISIKHGTELRMEDLNRTDIAKYVQQQLETSSVLSSDASFAEEIVLKAQGVFLWTVLVLKRLLKAYDQGRPIRELHEILQRTPDELNKLFESIFASLDPELLDDTLHLVYWVLFARVPLYLDSLQIALVFSSKNTPISLASWASSLRGPERLHASLDNRNAHFRRFITERSGGLFEVVSPKREERQKEYYDPFEESGGPKIWLDRSPRTINPKFWNISSVEKECLIDPSAYTQSDQYSVPSWRDILTKLETETSFVQVIHESVRDFLLSDSSPLSRNSDSFADESNYALFQSCAKFLQCQELSCALPIFQHRKQFPITVPQLVKDGDVWMNSSFTAYARACVWEHFRRSKTNDYSLPSLKGQADFARATFKQWWSLELCAGNSEVTGSSSIIHLDRKELTIKQRWLQQCSRLVGYGILTMEDAIQDRDCAENFHQGLLTLLFNNTTQQSGRPSECSFVAASHHGLDRPVNVFVQHGIAIDCVDLRGHTALLEAVRGNHTTTVRLLLEKRANTESSSLWIDTPLFAAAKLGSLAIVKLLLMYGADAHSRNWANETPIHNAAAGGHVLCARALIHRRVDIDHPDQYLETPLFKAIKTNQVSTAELLLNAGANIEALNKLGNSPLIESARYGSFSVTRLLLARGANHEVTGWFRTTALYWAAVSGHEDITLALLRAGATILLGVEEVLVEDDSRDGDLSDDLDDVVSENSDLASTDKGSKDSLEFMSAQVSKNPYNRQHVSGKVKAAKVFIEQLQTRAGLKSQDHDV